MKKYLTATEPRALLGESAEAFAVVKEDRMDKKRVTIAIECNADSGIYHALLGLIASLPLIRWHGLDGWRVEERRVYEQ